MSRRAFSSSTTASRLEDVFLQRYGWLRTRALALVDGDRARADDLVHDVFVELLGIQLPVGVFGLGFLGI